MLTVVIPTLNAADGLPRTLASVQDARANGLITAVIVADGGSTDTTAQIASAANAEIVTAPRGRGAQLRTGGERALEHGATWLLFLHADTILEPGWDIAARQFIEQHDPVLPRAAAFRFVLDDDRNRARTVERFVAFRTRTFGMPFGDQGLLISRDHYVATGGFGDMPLMEDVDLVRRIGREHITMLDAAAITSATRYERSGYILRTVRNFFCLSFYFLGVPPRILVRLYG